MSQLDKEIRVRVYILDSLIARTGEILSPNVIEQIAKEIQERMLEIINEQPRINPNYQGYEHD